MNDRQTDTTRGEREMYIFIERKRTETQTNKTCKAKGNCDNNRQRATKGQRKSVGDEGVGTK